MRALAWLGRQGPRILALMVFAGIAVPALGALLKPWVTEAVFALLCIAFVQMDPALLRSHLSRPWLAVAGVAWTTLVIPLLFGLACLATGLEELSPALFLAIMLQGVASPMMSGPALAALIGLDATLVLITLVASTAVIPLTAPFFAWIFAGEALTLSPADLGLKLLAILAGAFIAALAIRWIMGAERVRARRDEINGVNVIVLFVFVAAVMESVGATLIARPLLTLGLVALCFAVFALLLALTCLVFARAGRARTLAMGFTASQRNMGLMLAATGGAVPDLTWLYFALAQFPIYLAPQLLAPVARRVLDREEKERLAKSAAARGPQL